MLPKISQATRGRPNPSRRKFGAILVLLMMTFSYSCAADEGSGGETDDDQTQTTNGEDATEGEDTTPNDSETITLRLSATPTEATGLGSTYIWWGEELERRSDGRISVEFFLGDSLIPPLEVKDGLLEGTTDVGQISNVFHLEDWPLFTVPTFAIAENPWDLARAFDDLANNNETLSSEFESLGLRPLVWIGISQDVMGWDRPVNSPDDLEGVRLRATGGAAGVAMELTGADIVRIEIPELYESLQRGVVDAWQGGPFELAVALSLYEVAPVTTNHQLGTAAAMALWMSNDKWDSLPDDVQNIIAEVSEDYYTEAPQIVMDVEAELCDQFLSEGATVHVLPDDEAAAWRDEARTAAVDDWMARAEEHYDQETVESFFDSYLQALDDHAGESDYEDGVERCVEKQEAQG